MYEELNAYRNWNSALLKYFFPTGKEDAILYIDENVLAQVANEANLRKADSLSWSESLLSSTLLASESLNSFVGEWAGYTGSSISSVGKARTWEKLVEELIKQKFGDGSPAYFAMLCSIMLLASIAGAFHPGIKKEAQKYLGEKYSKKPGELIDPLLQQLHRDKRSFNANRMLCGKLRHISRIQYHLVLRKEQREDFIDFLEINNLRWGYETYDFFVNNILVPALDRAHKRELVSFVIKQENISYVKNILKSNLNYGKPVADSVCGNIVQEKVIRWKYVLEIDYSGELFFSIQCDYNNTPFNIVINGDSFLIDSSTAFSELIATGVPLKERPSVILSHGDERYVFCNVSEDVMNGCLYFEQIDMGYYIQVDEPQVGRSYYMFKPDKVNIKLQQNWKNIEYISCPGYTVYEIDEYKQVCGKEIRRPRTEDNYKFVQMGSWFSVNLEKGYSVYWRSNVLNSDPVLVTSAHTGQDGKTYFRIKPTSSYLSGDIIIRDSDNNDIYTEQISHDFEWDGERASYHMNGWGEITDVPMSSASITRHSSGKLLLQNSRSTTVGADILLQMLFDIADKNGCVSSRKMVAALEFALSFHGIVPTANNKKSVIYALRRLGYMISYYDVDRQEYVNQLLSKYVEKSNYSFNSYNNAYFVKGVYNTEALEKLLHNTSAIYRKRPYDDNVLVRRPEYACLPDVILFELKGDNDWARYDFQISDYMIATMQSMDKFEKKFMDDKYANQYRGIIPYCAPSMIKDGQGRETLCIRKLDNSYVTYNYYSDGVYLRPIPKHLARVYVQNERKMPVGIINWNRYNRAIDYSKLSFVSGMGVPEVLDIALCDTNLGMPSVDEIFVVNQKELGIDSTKPTTERRIYSTNATNSNNFHVLEVVRKLSAREVTSLDSNPEIIYIAKNLSDGCYKMYLEKRYAYNKDMLLFYCQSDLLAFSLGREVYYLDPVLKNYRKVLDQDVNSALSKIYKNQKDSLQLGEIYCGIIPQADSDRRVEIPIIERQVL